MDVKSTFLNGEQDENISMKQTLGFFERGKENLVCKLNKSIYGLSKLVNNGPRNLKVVIASGFPKNKIDKCIYMKIAKSTFIFMVLYVDDILLASTRAKLIVRRN